MNESMQMEIQESPTEKRIPLFRKEGFWRRQFSDTISIPQLLFDAAFGILLPILCFKLRPSFLFGFGSNPNINEWPLIESVYVSMIFLSIWLIFRENFPRFCGFLSGAMWYGAAVALCFAVMVVPLALLVTVGSAFSEPLLSAFACLGMIPLITLAVYVRNGMRAYFVARKSPLRILVFVQILVGGVLVFLLAAIAKHISASISFL